jgi:hypothetical protein
MVIVTIPCNSCFGRCFCGCCVKQREKYKQHVRAIYPAPEAAEAAQSVPQNLGALTGYAQTHSVLLPDIARYLQRLLHRDLDEGRLGFVANDLSSFFALFLNRPCP